MGWEERARSWLSSRPSGTAAPTPAEMDAWLDSPHSPSPPDDLNSQPRAAVHQLILAAHRLLLEGETQAGDAAAPSQAAGRRPNSAGPLKHQFQRTDLWIPMYEWLESLEAKEVVTAKAIADWLAENPEVKGRLLSRHSKHHLTHYIQKMHTKMLRKRGIVQAGAEHHDGRISKTLNRKMTTQVTTTSETGELRFSGLPRDGYSKVAAFAGVWRFSEVVRAGKMPSDSLKDKNKEPSSLRKQEALRRYEILTELENQLTSLLQKANKQP